MTDLAEPYDAKREWEQIDRPQLRKDALEARAIRYERAYLEGGVVGLVQELEREER